MTEDKKRESNPKIKELGWEDLEPTALIDRTLMKLKNASDKAKRLAERAFPGEPAPR